MLVVTNLSPASHFANAAPSQAAAPLAVGGLRWCGEASEASHLGFVLRQCCIYMILKRFHYTVDVTDRPRSPILQLASPSEALQE